MIGILLMIATSGAAPALEAGVRPLSEPVRPWAPDWRDRDRDATTVARVGGAMAALGPLVMLAAAPAVDTPVGGRVAWAGQWGTLLGPPMLAGGSLRSRRALREQGLSVDGTGGGLAWAMFATTLAGGALAIAALEADRPDLAAVPAVAVPFCYASGAVAGFVQLGANRRARRRR